MCRPNTRYYLVTHSYDLNEKKKRTVKDQAMNFIRYNRTVNMNLQKKFSLLFYILIVTSSKKIMNHNNNIIMPLRTDHIFLLFRYTHPQSVALNN